MAVAREISLHEALWLAPDRLHHPRPGVADADVACLARPRIDRLALIVEDDRVNTQGCGAAAPRLHRLQRRERAAHETAGLGHPPGVDDRRIAFADDFVIPPP